MIKINFQSVFQTTTAPAIALGTLAETPDGRIWQYVYAVSALDRGSVGVPTAVTAVDLVSSAADSLGRIVYITKASAGWTPGAFIDSWVVVDDGTGVGQTAQIYANTADTLQLYPAYALTTALAVADSDITISSPARLVKSAVTSKKQNAQAVAQIAFAAGTYGYALRKGVGTVRAGVSLTPVGSSFSTGDDTTGQVILGVATEGPFAAQTLGMVLVVNAAADQLVLVDISI